MKEGNRSYLRGDYAAAIERYDAALRSVPRLPAAYLDRAYSEEALFRSATDSTERERLATEGVRSFQSYVETSAAPGARRDSNALDREQVEERILTLLIDSQQGDAAIAHLQDRVRSEPRDLAAYELLGQLEAESGRMQPALQAHRDAIAALPDKPEAYYDLGAFVWQLSYRDAGMPAAQRAPILDEGISALTKALELRPDDPETLVYLNLLDLEKAKCAANAAERAAFEAQAKTYRDRALALRGATATAGR